MGDQAAHIGLNGAGMIAKLVHNYASAVMGVARVDIFTMGIKSGVEPFDFVGGGATGATDRQRTFDRLGRFLSGQRSGRLRLRLLHRIVAHCWSQAATPPARLVRQMPAAWCEPDQESKMVLKIERFQPEGMNVRMSGGKPSYSHAVTVSGTGNIVYTAGQLARDIDGNCVGKGDMRAQMEQTFQNLDRCLKAAGATWADVVKTNTFVTDFDEFQKCADIRMRYLGVATPTSTTVGVTRLAGPDFMIEIEAVAVVNS
jgi:enamine deaminase RidA (YjgF/YER057c/UK114 family)